MVLLEIGTNSERVHSAYQELIVVGGNNNGDESYVPYE